MIMTELITIVHSHYMHKKMYAFMFLFMVVGGVIFTSFMIFNITITFQKIRVGITNILPKCKLLHVL